jgi:hypothetical protein
VDIDEAVAEIVFATEQVLDLDLIDTLLESVNRLFEVALYRFAFVRQLHESFQIGKLIQELAADLNFGAQAAAALQYFAGSFWLVPEAGLGELPLDPGQLALLSLEVKDTP